MDDRETLQAPHFIRLALHLLKCRVRVSLPQQHKAEPVVRIDGGGPQLDRFSESALGLHQTTGREVRDTEMAIGRGMQRVALDCGQVQFNAIADASEDQVEARSSV